MGHRQAAQVEKQVQLDRQVKLFALNGPRHSATGRETIGTVAVVWAAIVTGTEFKIGTDSSIALGGSRVVIRWAEPWASLGAAGIRASLDLDATAGDPVAKVTEIGRRRFLQLELT